MWFVAPAMFLVGFAAHAEEALVTGYHLKPASAVVKTSGTVKLKLVYCFVVNDKAEGKHKGQSSDKPKKKYADDDLAPLVPESSGEAKTKYADDDLAPLVPPPPGKPKDKYADDDLAPLPYLVCEGEDGYDRFVGELAPLVSPVDVQWKVDGQGRVSGDKKSATYHAPASRPTPNKATVAASLSYNVGKGKTILLSSITIFDEVKSYSGTFSVNDVSVNTEYTRILTGKIRWEFDEYYEEGRWREYTGSGTATLKVSRTGCGTAANFADVPVEGRLKVYDDRKYEFLINLVGDKEQTRTCRRPDLDKDLQWEETFSSGGDSVSSGDPCGASEFYPGATDISSQVSLKRYADSQASKSYPSYTDITRLAFKRKGGCSNNVVNRFEERWLFEAVE